MSKKSKQSSTGVEWSASDLFDRLFENDRKILDDVSKKADRDDINALSDLLRKHSADDAANFEKLTTAVNAEKITRQTEKESTQAVHRFQGRMWQFAIAASGLGASIAIILSAIH